MIVDILTGGVRGGTPILYAALGETVSERSGVINLGVEGAMLGGACSAYMVAAESGNPWLAILVGALVGALLGSVHAILVVLRGANQFASGLAVLFLSLGLTSLYGARYVGRTITPLETWSVPGLSDIPAVGQIFFQHDPLVYASYVAVPAVFLFLFRTRTGLLIRTAGERAEALTVHGVSIRKVRVLAVVLGSALAGVGGAHLSIAYTSSWFENMVAGRGFIAVALVIFASWSPLRALGGAYLFGAALAISPVLQANGYAINQFALHVLPFVLTIAVLAILGRRTLNAAPAELKRVFENAPPDS